MWLVTTLPVTSSPAPPRSSDRYPCSRAWLHPRRPLCGHFNCQKHRTYYVLTTIAVLALINWVLLPLIYSCTIPCAEDDPVGATHPTSSLPVTAGVLATTRSPSRRTICAAFRKKGEG